jgi:hypothetical protein
LHRGATVIKRLELSRDGRHLMVVSMTKVATLNPAQSTLNLQPNTLNPAHQTLNLQPNILNPAHHTLNLQPNNLNPAHQTLNLQPNILDPAHQTLNLQPNILNPKPLDPKPLLTFYTPKPCCTHKTLNPEL